MIKQLPSIADIALTGEKELFVIHDRNVAWVTQEVCKYLPVKGCFSIDTSEDLKTMDTVLALERQLMEADASRGAMLLAIGGGITTDMVGFTAAIYKRGIRYANLPTTLLSQVDAAIGGKTGVNLDGYKNMLGAFHMPEFTFLCPAVLETLPKRELLCGLAEMLKTFLLADGDAYFDTVSLFSADSATKTPDFVRILNRAAQIKAEIVERDPKEHGERAKLNLGHTFGHAIEHQARLHGDDIAHGEAVAIGIILAAQLGESLGISEKGLSQTLEEDFANIGLPTECPYPLESLKEAMAKDKKAQGGGKVNFVLPVRPGEVVFHQMNPYDLHFDTK